MRAARVCAHAALLARDGFQHPPREVGTAHVASAQDRGDAAPGEPLGLLEKGGNPKRCGRLDDERRAAQRAWGWPTEDAGVRSVGIMQSVNGDADTLELAIELACRAHRGQRYPAPEPEPYIQHALRVMLAVSGFRAQTAAVLHDVLEDTAVTVEELREAGLPSVSSMPWSH
jgi:hypothetical protein